MLRRSWPNSDGLFCEERSGPVGVPGREPKEADLDPWPEPARAGASAEPGTRRNRAGGSLHRGEETGRHSTSDSEPGHAVFRVRSFAADSCQSFRPPEFEYALRLGSYPSIACPFTLRSHETAFPKFSCSMKLFLPVLGKTRIAAGAGSLAERAEPRELCGAKPARPRLLANMPGNDGGLSSARHAFCIGRGGARQVTAQGRGGARRLIGSASCRSTSPVGPLLRARPDVCRLVTSNRQIGRIAPKTRVCPASAPGWHQSTEKLNA